MKSTAQRNDAVNLEQGEYLRLRNVAGREINVVDGKVWLTQDGDLKDRVLVSGDRFRFDRDGLALVMPLKNEASIALDDKPGSDREIDIATRVFMRRPWRAPTRGGAAEKPLATERPYNSVEYQLEVRRARAEAIATILVSVARAVSKLFEWISAKCRGDTPRQRA